MNCIINHELTYHVDTIWTWFFYWYFNVLTSLQYLIYSCLQVCNMIIVRVVALTSTHTRILLRNRAGFIYTSWLYLLQFYEALSNFSKKLEIFNIYKMKTCEGGNRYWLFPPYRLFQKKVPSSIILLYIYKEYPFLLSKQVPICLIQ